MRLRHRPLRNQHKHVLQRRLVGGPALALGAVLTLAAIANPGKIGLASAIVAYSAVDNAFRNYMAHYNHGRGIVFIGHSQGAMLLINLLEDRVDTAPEVRKVLVSALLLGGSATTAPGKTTGGDFSEIPTCASITQTGCVFGYSSFDETPPTDAMFGRTATAAVVGRTSSSRVRS